MESKICFKCGERKPLTEFYAHAQMADGHLNKCKECTKKDVHENYQKHRDYYRNDYEHSEKRVTSRRKRSNKALRKWREKYPEKDRAHRILHYHLRKGNISRPAVCQRCGKECIPDAHHSDYSKPLDVMWLCRQCHHVTHQETND